MVQRYITSMLLASADFDAHVTPQRTIRVSAIDNIRTEKLHDLVLPVTKSGPKKRYQEIKIQKIFYIKQRSGLFAIKTTISKKHHVSSNHRPWPI